MTEDVKSYKFRIKIQEQRAAEYLARHDYDKLLYAVSRLIALREGLREVHFQEAREEFGHVGE